VLLLPAAAAIRLSVTHEFSQWTRLNESELVELPKINLCRNEPFIKVLIFGPLKRAGRQTKEPTKQQRVVGLENVMLWRYFCVSLDVDESEFQIVESYK